MTSAKPQYDPSTTYRSPAATPNRRADRGGAGADFGRESRPVRRVRPHSRRAATNRTAFVATSQPHEEAWSAGWRWLVEFFTTGNVVAKVGIIILFFGAAFLVRYAADRGLLPIGSRLMGLVVAALVLLVIGWRLRRTRPAYATALQGGAVGLLYLAIFAAFRLYALLPALLTFALLLAVVAFSVVLAVFQDAKSLAVLGTSGGFLAPILASTGSGDHVGLFLSYRSSTQASWRSRGSAPGASSTGSASSSRSDRLRMGSAVIPACAVSIDGALPGSLLCVLLVGCRSLRVAAAAALRGYVDGSLVFGLPALAFSMQSAWCETSPLVARIRPWRCQRCICVGWRIAAAPRAADAD